MPPCRRCSGRRAGLAQPVARQWRHTTVAALSPGETQVHVNLLYSLQGPLAQFSRSGLVQDFVRRMIADFGNNVTARLRRRRGRGTGPGQLQSHGHVLQRAVGAHQAVVRPGRLTEAPAASGVDT